MHDLIRLLRHLVGGVIVRRAFPASVLGRIEAAVSESERHHRGELRVVIQGGIGWRALLGLPDSRCVALAHFAALGLGATREQTGVLIHLLLAERRLEIVADRGIDACVGAPVWQAIAASASAQFAAGQWLAGLLGAIEAIGGQLAQHFPAEGHNPDELPDRPLRL